MQDLAPKLPLPTKTVMGKQLQGWAIVKWRKNDATKQNATQRNAPCSNWG